MPENLRTLRRKREIVGEIRQITRAMKLVSAAKLKRATSARQAIQTYFDEVKSALALVAGRVQEPSHPWLVEREVERVGLLLAAGDKGLCGAFNANLVREARQFVRESSVRVRTFTIGTRTADMARRARLNVVREFPAIEQRERGADVEEIVHYLTGAYHAGEVDRVVICYACFLSRISNEPQIVRLLPVQMPEARPDPQMHLFEPDLEELVEQLVPQYMTAHVFEALLSSAASEHSARLMAMTAATDNAEEMLEDLTRDINRARQSEITRELLDVVGGAVALERQR
ncbi:MAG: ATP synthase F1 subunit gamma [Armatimonadota bacterium]|nr:ATP synthase F1 subunit gamma [Armatimonadota bacterium]